VTYYPVWDVVRGIGVSLSKDIFSLTLDPLGTPFAADWIGLSVGCADEAGYYVNVKMQGTADLTQSAGAAKIATITTTGAISAGRYGLALTHGTGIAIEPAAWTPPKTTDTRMYSKAALAYPTPDTLRVWAAAGADINTAPGTYTGTVVITVTGATP
jgi:hypothetical protein